MLIVLRHKEKLVRRDAWALHKITELKRGASIRTRGRLAPGPPLFFFLLLFSVVTTLNVKSILFTNIGVCVIVDSKYSAAQQVSRTLTEISGLLINNSTPPPARGNPHPNL